MGVDKITDDDYFELRKRFIFDTAFNAEDLLTSLLVLLESLRTVFKIRLITEHIN